MYERHDLIKSNISKGDVAKSRSDYNSALNYYLEAARHIVTTNWHLPVRQKVHSIFLADINDDGHNEILFGTEGHLLFAYQTELENGEKEPRQLWSFRTNDWVTGISVADMNNDGKKEIIVASDKVYILNCEGEKIKEQYFESSISAMQIYDNMHGTKVIAVGDIHGNIKCYDFNFSEIWILPFKAGGAIIDIAVGDFDGDGRVEVAAASEDKYVYIINDAGEEKDKINARHWIVNLASCKMKNSKLRLFVGKFTGDTLVYKHKQTSQVVALKQSGILDLKVEYIFEHMNFPQFIVGSSDRCLSIFDYSGEPIWIFESGLGQRAIDVKKNTNGELELFVGTESGDVFSYSLKIVNDLVLKIKDVYNKSGIVDLLDLKIESEKLKILRNYIEYNPINHNAAGCELRNFSDFNDAVTSMMEMWFNSCGFVWEYKTAGRIYDLAQIVIGEEHGLLVGSDDGTLYCLTHYGALKWRFNSQNDLQDTVQGIRGVIADCTDSSIFTVSADKSLYRLNIDGKPEWNFCHEDWMLFTICGTFNGNDRKSVFVGTEDGFVLAFDDTGLLTWKRKLERRVRALSFCNNYYGKSYVVAGCDDNKVYIIDAIGNVVKQFLTPHYVLVVKAYDIDDDGKIEILTGNEDGHLHVYDFEGKLLWRFETESWVAALDVFRNSENGEVEIAIGSQDNHIYVLNKFGALLWQYEANARVRTISIDEETNRIAFGSYDNSAYMLEQIDRDVTFNALQELYSRYNVSKQIQRLTTSESRYTRAFAYLFTTDESILKSGQSDQSDIVIAAIGSNLIENFLPKNKCEDILTNLLIHASRRVKAVILCKLAKLMERKKIRKIIVSRIMSNVIIGTEIAMSKIDVFRYWLTMTESCDDILRLTECLIPQNGIVTDEFLIDEINRACLVAISKSTGDSGDYTIIEKVRKIALFIQEKYADTAEQLSKLF
ncbi:FG-GAP-like repeat-containing protein [Lachnospiraceae bacterium 38-14]